VHALTIFRQIAVLSGALFMTISSLSEAEVETVRIDVSNYVKGNVRTWNDDGIESDANWLHFRSGWSPNGRYLWVSFLSDVSSKKERYSRVEEYDKDGGSPEKDSDAERRYIWQGNWTVLLVGPVDCDPPHITNTKIRVLVDEPFHMVREGLFLGVCAPSAAWTKDGRCFLHGSSVDPREAGWVMYRAGQDQRPTEPVFSFPRFGLYCYGSLVWRYDMQAFAYQNCDTLYVVNLGNGGVSRRVVALPAYSCWSCGVIEWLDDHSFVFTHILYAPGDKGRWKEVQLTVREGKELSTEIVKWISSEQQLAVEQERLDEKDNWEWPRGPSDWEVTYTGCKKRVWRFETVDNWSDVPTSEVINDWRDMIGKVFLRISVD
jgi:hypothetical protein